MKDHDHGSCRPPVYAASNCTVLTRTELLTTFKVESCFQIKKVTPEIADQMADTLA